MPLAVRTLKEGAPTRYNIEFALSPEVIEESLRRAFNNGLLVLHLRGRGRRMKKVSNLEELEQESARRTDYSDSEAG